MTNDILTHSDVLCAVCRKPVTIGDANCVDHFIYEFDGELDYIELLHRACAEREGLAIDAEGHIGKRASFTEVLAAEGATAEYEAWLASLEAEDLTEREQAFFYHLNFNGRCA